MILLNFSCAKEDPYFKGHSNVLGGEMPFNVNGTSILHDILFFENIDLISNIEIQIDSFSNFFISDTNNDCSVDTGYIAFENQLNFFSLRKKIEEETTTLEENDDLWDYNDPDNHFIIDDFTRTICNEYSEYGIGNVVYKYINEYALLEITDDFEAVDCLRESSINNMPACLVNTNITINSYLQEENVEAQFTINRNNNEVMFINHSLNADEFYWDFGDGNTSTEMEPIHIYENPFVEHEVTLVAIKNYDGNHIYNKFNRNVNAKGNCELDVKYNKSIDNPLEYEFFLDFNTSINDIEKIVFNWGDGSPKDIIKSLPTQGTTYEKTHEFTSQGKVKVKITAYYSNDCQDKFEREIVVGINDDCFLWKSRKDDSKYANNTRFIKYKFFIKNSPHHHRIKAKVKHYKIKSNGSRKRTKADYLAANYIGTVYYSGECGNDPNNVNLPTERTNKKKAVCKTVNSWGLNDTDKRRVKNNEITANFVAIDNGGSITKSLTLRPLF